MQSTEDTAAAEEGNVNSLLEHVAGSYYDERTNVKDIYGEIKAALGDSKIFEFNIVSGIITYDMKTGALYTSLNLGSFDYTENYNSYYKQGGIDVCGDLAVIRMIDSMGGIG